MKNPGESYDGQGPKKHVKPGKTAAGKITSLPMKKTVSSSQNLVVPSENYAESKFQNQLDAQGISSKQKTADSKPILDPSVALKVSNDDGPTSVSEAKNLDKQKIGAFQSKNMSDKYKDANASSDASPRKYREKTAHGHSKSQPRRPTSNTDDLESTGRLKEKNGICELPDLNLTASKSAVHAAVSSCFLFHFVFLNFQFFY